jgi:WD40 repeat protein
MDSTMPSSTPAAGDRHRSWWRSPAPIAGLFLLILALGGVADFLRGLQAARFAGIESYEMPLVAISQDFATWSGVPVRRPQEAIATGNATRVQELARWGQGRVADLAWSPDGQLLAAATSLGVYLYGAQSITPVQFLPTATPVQSVAFSPDGQIIAAAGETMASVWRLPEGVLLRTVEELPGGTQDVVLTPGDDLVLAGVVLLGPAWVWAGGNTVILNPPEGSDWFADVDMVVVSPDGQTVAGAAFAGPIWLWQASDGVLQSILQGPDEFETVDRLAFSPDGQLLASSDTYSVRLWDVTEGTLRRTIRERTPMAWCLAFSGDGQLLATGGRDGDARLWRIADGTLAAIQQYTALVSSIALSPDGQTLGVALLGDSVRLGLVAQGSQSQVWPGHLLTIDGLAFSPDGESLAVSAFDSVWLWGLAAGAPFLRLWEYWPGERAALMPVSSVAFAPDGQTVAAGVSGGRILLWRAADGTLVRTLSIPLGGWALNSFGVPLIGQVAFSPDGGLLAAGWAGSLLLWRPADGVLLHEYHEESYLTTIASAAFSPDGQFLAYGSSTGQVVLRPVQGGLWVRTLGREGEQASDLVFSSDGQLLACACGQQMELWRAADGSSPFPFWWHEGRVLSVAFSPDGSILASGGEDRLIRLWRVSDGRLLRLLSGHTEAVSQLVFSPDGTLLASGSRDGTVRLWGIR